MSDTLTLLREPPATRTPPSVLPPQRRRATRWPVWTLGLEVGVLVLTAALITVILGGGLEQPCSAPSLPGSYTGPGSLGGVAGTGVSATELAAARAIPGLGGTRITPGVYSPTAYFPNPNAPATNCSASGSCLSTASGIRVNNATRRAYLIASNPQLNQYGALAYIWPNPYGWNGPFVVADTGGAFSGAGRLDFYIFIDTGQTWQQALAKAYEWGPAQQVRVSNTADRARRAQHRRGGRRLRRARPADRWAAKVAQVAQRYLGDGPDIPAFIPPSTAWSGAPGLPATCGASPAWRSRPPTRPRTSTRGARRTTPSGKTTGNRRPAPRRRSDQRSSSAQARRAPVRHGTSRW